MNLKKKKINFITFFLLFLYIQPILDVFFAVSNNYFDLSISVNSIIRIIFMLIAIIYLLFINKDKKSKIMTIILLAYMTAFSGNIYFSKHISALIYELKSMLSTFFFPITLLFLHKYQDNNKLNINKKHFIILSLIYLGFILIPNLLGVGFDTYQTDKQGSVGWFYSANGVGAVLIILLPIGLLYFDKKKKLPFLILYSFLILYTFLTIGTKAPLLGLIILLGFIILWFLIKFIKEKKYKLLIGMGVSCLIFLTSLILLLPQTNFYKNIIHHMNAFDIYTINDIFTSNKFINQVVFSKRLDFLQVTKNNYHNANLIEKFIGIGYKENQGTLQENIKTIEMDYFDIYYRHGVIGFIVYFMPLVFVMYDIIKKTKKLTFQKYMYFVSIFLGLLLALFCGHIFTAPAVSIILIYIIVSLKERCEESES